ncbi:hypothetical protein JCM10914A_08000 [Paenibacillus sp. JCM 10914]|uniref:hypothetical protein n=1 Tax=Paenibacillus sp. JCM 10914 TaxID=1236974 RepID=UPI0003CC6639|nr:hypothetical protein [Paenibacillus sp. JCM 10914]GAE05689.1 hypothetical protein JCM10914_1805 [Paenibacillus sp. JCM 10914]
MRKGMALLISCMLLFVLAACGGEEPQGNSGITDTGVAPEAELVIKGTDFEFDQAEYHLKKGVPVQITYENEKGNHGIMIPALGLQLDRKNNTTVVTPDKAGEFEVSCSIMCGAGHSQMISKIIIEE